MLLPPIHSLHLCILSPTKLSPVPRHAADKFKTLSGTKRPVPLSDGATSVNGSQSKVTHHATPSTGQPSTGFLLTAKALQASPADVTTNTSTEAGESRKKKCKKGGEQLSLGLLSTANGGVGHIPPAADKCDTVLVHQHVNAATNGDKVRLCSGGNDSKLGTWLCGNFTPQEAQNNQGT